jgi:hypothetical protein
LEKKHGKKTIQGYFCSADEAEDRISFTFFPEGRDQLVERNTRMEAYQKSLEIVRAAAMEEGNSFLPVDSVTAKSLLEQYRGEK